MTAIDLSIRLMAGLRDMAGESLPSDASLAAELGCREDQAAEALAFLEANGLIRVNRTVEILAERKAA